MSRAVPGLRGIAPLEQQRQASRHQADARAAGRDLLVQPAQRIDIGADLAAHGDDAQADFVADEDQRTGCLFDGLQQTGDGRAVDEAIDPVVMVGQPERQAVDDQQTMRLAVTADDTGQVVRFFHRLHGGELPLAVGPVTGNAGAHVVVVRLGSGDEQGFAVRNIRLEPLHGQLLGAAGLAAALATEDEFVHAPSPAGRNSAAVRAGEPANQAWK